MHKLLVTISTKLNKNTIICDKAIKIRNFLTFRRELSSKTTKMMESATNLLDDKTLFPDLPKGGPLEIYRQNASFDWRKLRLLLSDEYALRLKHKVWSFLESHPLFSRDIKAETFDEIRHLTAKRMFVYQNEKFFTVNEFLARPDLGGFYSGLSMAYDPSFSVKFGLGFGMFNSVLRTLGTERLIDFVEQNDRAEIVGAFELTEIGHGSNAKGMRTTATYDTKAKEFVLNSPDFEAAKCWAGNLGQTATHAIIYAQLYTEDETHHGLNAFLVPIRDPKTLVAYPNLLVGDLGEKVGLNGIDNGFVMFKNYRIPKEYLLSKTGDINEKGEFVSPFKDKNKRFGASLGALSAGRVSIAGFANIYLQKALTIAIRYSAARKQFGPDEKDEEWPVLEYQSQQFRLFPHLATFYAINIFSTWFSKVYGDMFIQSLMGENVSSIGMEIHALSSAAKPVCTWAARDGIQECREACGGHGYLKVAKLGDLRNDNDANCTYEGENNILIQQASNWLIGLRSKGFMAFKDVSPLQSVTFLVNGDEIMKQKCNWLNVEEAMDIKNLLSAMNWLVCYILEETYQKVATLKSAGKSSFEIRNETQSFYARTLSITYGERMILQMFNTFLNNQPDSSEKEVLAKLASMFGANLVLKHAQFFFQGGYFSETPNASKLLQDGVIQLLPVIKNDAVTLVDALAEPDFILNSALGMANGEIYKNLEKTIMSNPYLTQRPTWWKEVVDREHYVKAKL